jgi:hypothetical protein
LLFGCLLGTTPAGCPLADHAQRAAKALGRQASPEFSAIAATRTPQLVEHRQVRIERTLPNPEDIRSLAPDHLADRFPAVAGAAHDLLDGSAFASKPHDRGIHLLASQESLVLELLRAGQQIGIDRGCTDRGPDRAHRSANGVQEG